MGNSDGAFQIVAGWGHQPGRPAVGGVPTAHMSQQCDNLECTQFGYGLFFHYFV